jgi:hypothetical protein
MQTWATFRQRWHRHHWALSGRDGAHRYHGRSGTRRNDLAPLGSTLVATRPPQMSAGDKNAIFGLRTFPKGSVESKSAQGDAGGRIFYFSCTRTVYLRYWDKIPDFYRVRVLFGRFDSICSLKYRLIGGTEIFENSKLLYLPSDSSRV